MAATFPEPYVVASCHVERPLDDRVWAAFAALQERPPGGVVVAALLRPPDPGAGERDEARWVERAREAAQRGPLGHHTHWTSPTHARPTGLGDPGERVAREGAWLRERRVSATLFCGGGWYGDLSVAAACATLGYADCTSRPAAPAYLAADAPRLELATPAWLALPDGRRLAALPTTHSAGDGVRAALSPRRAGRIHVYFHDTDLVDRRRRLTVEAALRLLGARHTRLTLEQELAALAPTTVVPWEQVARGGPSQGRP